jgi:ribosomal-protein-alanine N-acetyltransferase
LTIIWTRPFVPADSEPISAIVRETFTEVYPSGLWADIAAYWPEGVTVLLDDAEVVGAIAGVIDSSSSTRVLILVVRPSHRGRGLGKMLLDVHIRATLQRGIHTVKLEVRDGNEGAMRFYGRNGFRTIGKLPCFYTDGMDAWQMERAV